jgi:hypothetical protein
MDEGLLIFLFGSATGFLAIYWLLERRLHHRPRSRRPSRSTAAGGTKEQFLDTLRNEARLRAERAIRIASTHVRDREAASPPIPVDPEALDQLAETAHMIRMLLPRAVSSAFDKVLAAIQASSPPVNGEMTALIIEVERRLANLAAPPGGRRGHQVRMPSPLGNDAASQPPALVA